MTFEFPPPDLIDALIPLFFFHNNLYWPILHRPTFEQHYRERLHETETGFASILLLVCAIASRCSDDPRVLRPETPDGSLPPSRHSAGWKYFDQVKIQRKSLISPATLFDLQQYAVRIIFSDTVGDLLLTNSTARGNVLAGLCSTVCKLGHSWHRASCSPRRRCTPKTTISYPGDCKERIVEASFLVCLLF